MRILPSQATFLVCYMLRCTSPVAVSIGSWRFCLRITLVNRSEYKPPSCELQDLRRGKRGWVLVKKMRCGPWSPRSPMREGQEGVRRSWRRRAFG